MYLSKVTKYLYFVTFHHCILHRYYQWLFDSQSQWIFHKPDWFGSKVQFTDSVIWSQQLTVH